MVQVEYGKPIHEMTPKELEELMDHAVVDDSNAAQKIMHELGKNGEILVAQFNPLTQEIQKTQII